MDATTRMPDAACVADGTGRRTARVRDRDDACPGTLDAAQGDDGLIARIRLPGGRVSAAHLRALAAGARDFGKGVVDLTVRANVQVRGLSPLGVAALGTRLADAGLMPSPSHDRVRNISASPFAGRDRDALVDAEELVAALDTGLCADRELADLPGRFQFAVDDGGVRIATPRHDVALVADAPGSVGLHVAGVDTGLRASGGDAVELALRAARAFLRARVGNGAWHVRELPGGAEEFAAGLRHGTAEEAAGREGHSVPPRRAASPTVGVIAQHDGRFAVSALVPLGRLTDHHLHALADLAESATAGSPARVRLAPWRGVVVGDAAPEEVERVVAALDRLGLPTSPTSAWRRVSACSGVGECRRARTDVRALAREFVIRADNGDPGGPQAGMAGAVHFAACARACGRPVGAASVIAVPSADEPPGFSEEFEVTAADRSVADDVVGVVRALRPSASVGVVGAVGVAEVVGVADDPSVPRGVLPEPLRPPESPKPPLDTARTTPASRPLPERQRPVDDWLKDGAEIYRRSFATIRAEADLARFPDDVARVVVRMIHACGMTDLPDDIGFHPDVARAASAALRAGAPILCDAQMVASGVTRARLPRDNEVKCLLSDPRVPALAAAQGTTRSAAAVDLWGDDLAGAVVAVGNAPTTLFRLLELLDAGAPAPAAIVGVPVGFIGAAESKQALAERAGDIPYLVVHGRRGGSAMAAAAINAMASEKE